MEAEPTIAIVFRGPRLGRTDANGGGEANEIGFPPHLQELSTEEESALQLNDFKNSRYPNLEELKAWKHFCHTCSEHMTVYEQLPLYEQGLVLKGTSSLTYN